MSIIHIAALTIIVLLSACTKPNPGQPAASTPTKAVNSLYSPLKANGQITLARCHMGSCSWTKWLSVEPLGSSDSQQVLEATILEGSSQLEDVEDYPPSPKNVAINWNSEPYTVKVICSHTNPSVSNSILPLSPETDIPGAAESAARLYFAVCHSYFGDYPTGIEKFSYNVKEQKS